MIEKQTVIDKITISRDECIEIKWMDLFLEDGVEVATRERLRMLEPGDNVDQEHSRIKKITKALWAESVVQGYRRKGT